MGNVKEIFHNIVSNKNTLTVLLVFSGIIGLYMVYNWKVNDAITPVKIPYAKKEISSRTQITSDMVSYTEVPKSLVNKASNLVSNQNGIVGKYVNYGYTIPSGSFFYSESILNSSATPESEFANIPDGFTVYQLLVDFDTTYGNSIYPGNYIDLYVKTVDKDSNKIIFGRLIKGIKVMDVYDSAGNNVFETTSENRKPKYMDFAVPNDIFLLLRKAGYLNITILPIPRNESYSAEERSAEIDSVYLQNYILSRSVTFND